MKHLSKFESHGRDVRKFYEILYDKTKETVGNLHDLFNKYGDEYDVNLTISLHFDPNDDDLYDPWLLMDIDSEMAITCTYNRNEIIGYFSSDDYYEQFDETEIIYCLEISISGSEFRNDELSEITNSYLNDIENWYGFEQIREVNGINEIKIYFRINN